MSWTYVVTDLNGTQIGKVENPYEWNWHYERISLDTVRIRLRLDDPLATAITDRNGDVLCIAYDGSTRRFVGELTTAEEVGPNYHKVIDRQQLCNQAWSLGTAQDLNGQDVPYNLSASDTASQAARGLYEEVVPYTSDVPSLRQAYIREYVRIHATPRITVTYEPSQSGDPGLTCNFAGPLWRLQKRLLKVNTHDVPITDQNSAIAWGLIAGANLESATGILQGTLGSTITATQDFGDQTHIPISECLTNMADSKAFPFETPGTWADEDLFESGSGFLAGRTVAAGGTWGEAGSGGVFVVTPPYVQRGSWGDVGSGRYSFLSNVISGAVVAQTAAHYDTQRPSNGVFRLGVFCRYTSITQNLLAIMEASSGGAAYDRLYVFKNGSTLLDSTPMAVEPDTAYWLQIGADAQGNWACWCWPQSDPNSPVAPALNGYDADFATGGPLANGQCGIYGINTAAVGGQEFYFDHLRAGAIAQPLDWQGLDFEFVPATTPSFPTHIWDFNASAQIGTTKPTVVFDCGGGNTRVPTFGTDYIVGDTVTARGIYNNSARFNGLVRVFGVDVTNKENSGTTTSPNFAPD